MRSSRTAIARPPRIPSTSAMAVRTGIITTTATTRGTTRRRDGRDRHRAQGVDLLGHGHRADLGGDARSHAAAHHERRQDRPELADERQRDDAADEHLAAERLEGVGRLEGEHHAGEEGRDPGDRDGLDAELVHLPHDLGPVEGPREAVEDRLADELGQPAEVIDDGRALAAETVHEPQPAEVAIEDRRCGRFWWSHGRRRILRRRFQPCKRRTRRDLRLCYHPPPCGFCAPWASGS